LQELSDADVTKKLKICEQQKISIFGLVDLTFQTSDINFSFQRHMEWLTSQGSITHESP
jgi:hypothetical protein